MSLQIASLNSGSNANCYYIGNGAEAVLIDAGLSCRETEKRMNRLNLSMAKVRAIFVSHEHSDHISGLPGLTKKFQLPAYFTNATYKSCRLPIQEDLIQYFHPGNPVTIGKLEICPFPKLHDAIDPHSFVISQDGLRIGVFTDIGTPCNNVIDHFGKCDAAFLESNYCENMLENGNYPYHLKKRICGIKGHLSNKQAVELFVNHKGSNLGHLILSHLSKNNNCPELVSKLFTQVSGNTQVHVASRYSESPVFTINGGFQSTVSVKAALPTKQQLQLSLF